jgi:WD40 repeat protein
MRYSAAFICCQTLHGRAGSFDGLVMVWDVATAAPVHKLSGHEYQVTSVVVLPNGDIASASVDK